MSSSDQTYSVEAARKWLREHGNAEQAELASPAEVREMIQPTLTDLRRLVDGDPEALDPEYGFNNDELLRLGIGYGIPGPLSDEQVRHEAAEILSEIEAS